MQKNNTILIICGIIAVFAIIYMIPQPSRKTGEPVEPEPVVQPKQSTATTVKAQRASRRSRQSSDTPMPVEWSSPEPARIDNATVSRPQRRAPEPQQLKTPAKTDGPGPQGMAAQGVKTPEEKAQELERQVQAFKDRYQWDLPETAAMGGYMLETIPEQFRQAAMNNLMKSMDEAQLQQGARVVDERMLVESIEKTMPPNLRQSFRKLIDKYKAEQP